MSSTLNNEGEGNLDFCPECGIGLSNAQRAARICNNCHTDLTDALVKATKEEERINKLREEPASDAGESEGVEGKITEILLDFFPLRHRGEAAKAIYSEIIEPLQKKFEDVEIKYANCLAHMGAFDMDGFRKKVKEVFAQITDLQTIIDKKDKEITALKEQLKNWIDLPLDQDPKSIT